MTDFSIPEKYRDQLEVAVVADQRSHEEILECFSHYVPVTSEKNIWSFWHSGIANMPEWCQRNVVDWARICGPEWTVRVLDNVAGSPNNALKYVPEHMLPRAFLENTMDGDFIGQHSADFTRTACIYEHGGAWMDAGSILIRHMDRMCWNQLADDSTPFRVCVPVVFGRCVPNHFVAARKGDPFIYRWHQLFTHAWGDRNNCDGIVQSPLLAPHIPFMFPDGPSNWDPDFRIPPEKAVEYVGQILCWVRLTSLQDAGDGFSCADYWENNILTFDVFEEDWRGMKKYGTKGYGAKGLQCFALRRDEDPTSDQHKEAEDFVWELLTSASMEKITSAAGLTNTAHLGTLFAMPENKGKDCGPGTFAELLRYGALHFRQKREVIATVTPEKAKTLYKKGVLEP